MRQLTNYIPKSIIASDGLRIYYETTYVQNNTSKPILLFLHGLGSDCTAWDEERLAFLELGYPSIAVDLRGHGLSQRANDESFYSFERFKQDILEILKQEKIKNYSFVGHCFGGMLAMSIEENHKTGNALVLIDAGPKIPYLSDFIIDHKLAKKLLDFLAKHAPKNAKLSHVNYSNFLGTPQISMRRTYAEILQTSLHSWLLTLSNLLSVDLTNLLKNIKIPTLIIEAQYGSIVPPKMAELLQEKIRNSELEIIPGSNHIMVTNEPVELVVTIDKFLKNTLTSKYLFPNP